MKHLYKVLHNLQRIHDNYSEGNGTPLQCSCLENPRDGRAWWALVYGVAQSRTRLKRLSSHSSSSSLTFHYTEMNNLELPFLSVNIKGYEE